MQRKIKRTPVDLTDDEREEIRAAMKVHGIRAMAEFLRFAGLKVAREGARE